MWGDLNLIFELKRREISLVAVFRVQMSKKKIKIGTLNVFYGVYTTLEINLYKKKFLIFFNTFIIMLITWYRHKYLIGLTQTLINLRISFNSIKYMY